MRRLLQDVLNSEAMRELTSEMFPEAPQRRAVPPPPPMTEPRVQPPMTMQEPTARPPAQPAKTVVAADTGVRRPIVAAPAVVLRSAFSLGDKAELRRAIVIREVLDLPIALRKPEDQTYTPR